MRYVVLALFSGLAFAVAVQIMGTITRVEAESAQSQQPPLNAPTMDRVGLPEGYQTDYQVLYVFDRADNRSQRWVYANDLAASARPGEPFPYGSIIAMEVYRAILDERNNVLLDENGRYQSGDLTGIFVMRKEPGFGVDYGPIRNGEWEYVAYRADGSHLTPPERTQSCATCHLDSGGTRDWTWRTNLYFYGQSGALPTAPPGAERQPVNLLRHYLFLPTTNTVPAGTTFLWTNADSAVHTVTALDGSFDSGRMGPGATYLWTFTQPGTYDYFCAIHPSSMRASVLVQG